VERYGPVEAGDESPPHTKAGAGMHPTTPWCNFSDGQVHDLETGLDRFRFTELKMLYGMIPKGQWTGLSRYVSSYIKVDVLRL
jgi:hypothetical protein